MAAKARIAIVGAGNLATTLAGALRRAGYSIDAVVSRSARRSLAKARRLALQVGARALIPPADVQADVVWFCVSDSEISRAAEAWSWDFQWKGKVALHSSGAVSSDAFDALRKRGASVGSIHPLMTFVRGAHPSLKGVPFAVEGDSTSLRVARRIIRDLGGRAYPIRKQDKAAYHAWGTFASPLLTALLVTTEHVAGLAGVNPKEARRRMTPILRQTLENYAERGGAGGFSGPILRGDTETLKKHLHVLRDLPAARLVYTALARSALQYLPAKNRGRLKRLLDPGAD